MKTTLAKWILVSACAALLATTAQAAHRNSRESRHPDPRGRGDYSGHYASRSVTYCQPAPQPYYVYPSYPVPVAYYPPPPPPPPPVVYYPAPPVICYPIRPGFNITFSF